MRTREYITVQYVGNLGTIEDYVLISLLSMGELFDLDVECPQHGSRFNLVTGKVTGLPAVIPTVTYPVTVEGSEIFVEVPD